MEQKHIRCSAGESIYDALNRAIAEGVFPVDATLVVHGPGRQHPLEPDMIGTVCVRPRESFAVVSSST